MRKKFQRSPTSVPANKLTANFLCPLQICSKAPLPKWGPKKIGTQARTKGFVATLLAKIIQQAFANLHQSTLLTWCAPPFPQNCEQTRANSLKCFPQIDAKETPFWGSEKNHENGGYFRPSFPCFISQRNSSLLWVSFSDHQNGFFRVNLSKHLCYMEDHSRPARLIDVNLGIMAERF